MGTAGGSREPGFRNGRPVWERKRQGDGGQDQCARKTVREHCQGGDDEGDGTVGNYMACVRSGYCLGKKKRGGGEGVVWGEEGGF